MYERVVFGWSAATQEVLDEGMQRGFEVVGRKVSRWPRLVMATSVAVALLSGLGLLRATVESDDDKLYVPRGSEAVEQGEWVEKTFDVLQSSNHTKSISLYCVSARHSTKNVLDDREGMLALFDISATIFRSKGSGCTLSDYAHQNDFGNQLTQSAMQFWNNSKDSFLADPDWRRTLADRPLTLYGMSHTHGHEKPYAQRASLASVLGKAVLEDEERPSSAEDDQKDDEAYDAAADAGTAVVTVTVAARAEAFQAKYWYNGDLPDECTRAADEAVEKASPVNGALHCYLHSHTSYRDAVLEAISHDLILVVASVLILVLFATACFANQRDLRRGTKGWLLGPAALFGVSLALATTFGLWMFGGGYFHSLMGAAIFMVLGLGVDDAFVIVDALDLVWADAETKGTLPLDLGDDSAVGSIVGDALRQAGASILVTSATDGFAFAACALTTNIPALRSFCGVAALAVFFDFLFQITWFVGAVALETQRRLGVARRERLLSLLESEADSLVSLSHVGLLAASGYASSLVPSNDGYSSETKDAGTAARVAAYTPPPPHHSSGSSGSSSGSSATQNGGSSAEVADGLDVVETTSSNTKRKPWSRRVSKQAAEWILSPYVKVFVLASAAALIALGAVGGSRLELDYETKWMAPQGSMVRKAWDVEDEYFVKDNKWTVNAFSRDHDGGTLVAHLDDYVDAADDLGDLNWSKKTESWYRDSFRYWVGDVLYPDDDAKEAAVFEDAGAFDMAALQFEIDDAYLAEGNIAYEVVVGGLDDMRRGEEQSTQVPLGHCGAQTQIDLGLALEAAAEAGDAEALEEATALASSATICATKLSLSWDKIERKAKQIQMIDAAQKTLDRNAGARALHMFVLSTPTLEALAQTWNAVLKSISVAGAAVFVCCFLLLGCRLWAAVFMLLIVAAIDVVLVGSLYWIGEYCNMVTTVCLTLAVGLSIDFSAHLTHAFLHADAHGHHRESAVADAVDRMLAPIAKGGLSTLLAVTPMAFSDSYVIRLFFVICVLIISVGLFFGLLVVPVVLDAVVAPLLATCRRQRRRNDQDGGPISSSSSSGRRTKNHSSHDSLLELGERPASTSADDRYHLIHDDDDDFYDDDDDDDKANPRAAGKTKPVFASASASSSKRTKSDDAVELARSR